MTTFSAEELAHRRPVWEALSDLFLDTDVSLIRQWCVDILVASPCSEDELEFILIDEVYPVCKYNLLSVAGVWSGFDLQWLESRILQRASSRWKAFHSWNLGRLTVPRSMEWRATKSAIRVASEKIIH
ncbi:hypothetical protein [Rhodoferax sp. PAMC 29310]|uniref:DUF7079 family protein n=1 Tax=Rhodoferax sp. PAMC 29310 TaxID=2822760 RepID=UPI001B32E0E0|nr:hypothetical protein [Rhodoferax sp. PAMC 29310]